MSDNFDTEMNTEQAKSLLAQLLTSGLGISGHRRDNSADYYQCSACLARTSTTGYAGSTGMLDDVQHDSDCGLLKLAKWAGVEIGA